MHTLLLDRSKWDIVLDASGNIAVANDPYAMAQDAASAIKLFKGELYYNTVPGVPYFEEILGQSPPVSLMKAYFELAALRVPGVVRARCFITEWQNRTVRGQVQIWDRNGRVTAFNF